MKSTGTRISIILAVLLAGFSCLLLLTTNLPAQSRGVIPKPPVLDAYQALTNLTPVTVTGIARGASSVDVSGPRGVFSVPVSRGRFAARVPLAPNGLNQIMFTSISLADSPSSSGLRSAPTPAAITQDTQPPNLFIDFPADGAHLTNATIDVAGRVGDMLSGFMGLQVSVNGVAAAVDVGIGNNGTFLARGIPLVLDHPNVLSATATDVLGNTVGKQITVTRAAPSGPQMMLVSGNGQRAPVRTLLSDPIVVRVTEADGVTPFPNKIVTFHVTRSDGRLSADGTGEGSMIVEVRTDRNGVAQARWRVGSDAGCGNNRIEVTSTSISGTTFFCASTLPGPTAQINLGSGNNQRGEAGQRAPLPLRAWVSDACNGVGNVPVTFTVTRGTGRVNGLGSVTIATDVTGHAEVGFTLGPEPGNQEVEANYPGNLGLPVRFTALGVVRTANRPTSFSGLVMDNANQPIGGASCTLKISDEELSVFSLENGAFRFEDLPVAGPGHLRIDGLTADRLNGETIARDSFPFLEYQVVVIPNADNSLPMPALLPLLNRANFVTFDNSHDVDLTVEGIEGLRMTVKANSMTLPNGRRPSPRHPVPIALNAVHHDSVPMPMPDGVASLFAWTLQPAGSHFDPPIQITYPNMSALPPGANANFLSFNHGTNRFEIVASGHVVEDGSVILSDPGAGLSTAGWGANCPPYAVVGDCMHCPPIRSEIAGAAADGDSCDPCEAARRLRDFANRIGSDSASYPLHAQIACIAEIACRDPQLQEDPFIQMLLRELAAARDPQGGALVPTGILPFSIDDFCARLPLRVVRIPLPGGGGFELTNGDLCALCGGMGHIAFELVPRFVRYCGKINPSTHQRFLEEAVARCFADENAVPGLSPIPRAIAEDLVPRGIAWFRDYFARAVCPALRVVGATNVLGGTGPCSEGGFPTAPPPLTQKALFSPALARLGSLRIDVGQVFFLEEGNSVQLRVTQVLDNGSVVDVTDSSSGTEYFQPWGDEIATASPSGLVTAHRTPLPHVSMRFPFSVLVINGNDAGWAQFAIEAVDSDGDQIVDSFENAVGLDPGVPNYLTSDLDDDGLSDWIETMIGTSPLIADSDGDGVSDGREVLEGSDPQDPFSASVQLDDSWIARIGGQSTQVGGDGSVSLSNIAAPDAFGAGGPGTPPDFLSDEFLRLVATNNDGCRTRFAFSQPFQIRQGETFVARNLAFTESAAVFPRSLQLQANPVVIEVRQSTQLTTLATLGDNSVVDVTARHRWTVYRTSNPAVALVGPDGLVTGRRVGPAFITAVNDGATATRRIEVTRQIRMTTVEGFVQREDGTRVAGAQVTTALGGSASSDSTGFFSIAMLPVSAEVPVVTVTACASVAGGMGCGTAVGIPIFRGGITDVGVITIIRPHTGPIFPGPQFQVETTAESVVVGDLNGDGRSDVAAASAGGISILLGNGDGTFQARRTFPAGTEPSSLVFGDLDGDGHLDIAVANSGSDDVSILVGNGDGTFRVQRTFAVGFRPVAVAIGDLDADGRLDLVVANVFGDNVSILLGNGNGTFQGRTFMAQRRFGLGSNPSAVALSDLNADNRLDLVVAILGNISVLLGNGDGTFQQQTTFPAGFTGSIAVGDLNADDRLDLAVAIFDSVSVLLGNGDGTFQAPRTFPVGSSGRSLAAGHLDADGRVDFVVAASNTVSVLLGNGDG
ncbi:MAG: VCBS repeat-containing protein, partial [Planctomycetes bacterium]|nr:VCBS repeat-containing protein [Planctomycetota bacterium]